MDWFLTILAASWTMLILAAPFILLGLVAAGLIHVLLPESLVLRYMGTPGLWGVVRAALIGVPLPVCSCGVVPITVELRRKGASRPAAQSFLITTPESSIDSIFLTWGMLGPIVAIARPVAAFFTAVLGGVLSIGSARSLDELSGPPRPSDETAGDRSADALVQTQATEGHHHDDDHHHGHHDHHHHGHNHEHSLAFDGSPRARLALKRALAKILRRSAEDDATDSESGSDDATSIWRDLLRPALRYGFGELLDDLAFWLVFGIGLAGVLTAVLPDDLDTLGLGTGIMPMIALLVIGVPLYMCASASTPIAAALMLKGVSPGAALVFLLAGPATNAATVLQLAATFGRRFVTIYVVSVAAGALVSGLLLDLILADVDLITGLRASAEEGPGMLTVALGLLLAALIGRSLLRGAWSAGVLELRDAAERLRTKLPGAGRVRGRHVIVAGLAVATAAYALTGFHVVPPGSRGYGFLFGALARSGLEPGLRYLPPAPFGRWEVRHVGYPRKSDVGFRTDLSQIESRRRLVNPTSDEWHSPVAAMNTNPTQASYLTGDGALVELSFSVHYTLTDPEAFFYGIDHRRDFVNLYAEAVARELLAGLPLDELLTERRAEVEERIRHRLQEASKEQRLGIEVLAIRIVDLHPPGAAVRAFRDVSSAKEDRETAIHRARGELSRRIPRSRGLAVQRLADAEAQAWRRNQEALGESQSFTARAEPFGENRELLRHLLWIETMERTLEGRKKLILPPDRGPATTRGLTLWQDVEPRLPSFLEDEP